MTKKLALIGGGGHALSLIDILPSPHKAAGYVDFAPNPAMPIPLLGDDNTFAASFSPDEWEIIITLVSGQSCNLLFRSGIIGIYACYDSPVIVAPTAIVSPSTTLGAGTAVFHRAVVNAAAVTGRHCVINTGAIVEHGCHIGENVFIGPGAILCGEVSVGENCYIGAGAILQPGVNVCRECIIGAGAVVTHDITTTGTYVGVPARRIK